MILKFVNLVNSSKIFDLKKNEKKLTVIYKYIKLGQNQNILKHFIYLKK